MSWTDKALKRAKAEKMAKEIMSSKRYQDAKKKDMEQAGINAYCRFILISCDYLQMNFNCKRRGIMKWLRYASEVLLYTLEDENYYEDMNNVMIDECYVDVLKEIGFMIGKRKEND